MAVDVQSNCITDPILKQLLVGRFEPLAPYFKSLTLNDLVGIDAEDIVASVDPMMKLLALVFVRNHLHQFVEGTDTFAPFSETETCRHSVDDNGTLLLSGKVATTALAVVPQGMIPTHDLVSHILLTMARTTIESITSVNLLYSHMFDCDIPHIAALIRTLPNCTTLNLHGNRITGEMDQVLSNIRQILRDAITLNIVKNPFIGNNKGKEFLQSLTKEELSHLIWLSEPALRTTDSAWHTFFDSDTRSIVIHVHEVYYQLMRTTKYVYI
jgi:hypothetical protein